MKYQKNKGTQLVLVIVFAAIFMTIFAGLVNYVVSLNKLTKLRIAEAQARSIAEAGLDYYKWFLAHYPDDTTHGTGLPGPYLIPYEDPETSTTGNFELSISSSTYCGDVASIEIESTGWSLNNPTVKRTVYGKYARPTVAEYSYIINSNVWAGSDRTIIGPYHSNGGVRMDGTNNSTVTSGQSSWTCTSSFGCTGSQTVDGVFGSGPDSTLWYFPSTPINFTGLTIDLANMKDRAQNRGGIYIPPSGEYGYRVTFLGNGDVQFRTVDQTYNYWGYSTQDGWETERHVIDDDDPYLVATIDPDCPLIYVEDKVWLEGSVDQKVTIAAADTDSPTINPRIILNGNITYANASSGLLAIAEEDVLVGLVVPEDMELNGIFVAQNGRFGRNYYQTSGSYDVLTMHNSYVCQNSLTINGTIVSNGRVGTQWTGSYCGSYGSGFGTRYNSYDRNLVDSPPPLAPNTSDDYKFVDWRQVEN
ncbi:hypothetical protein KC723_02150 [Candidatus Kaiserbacteria bacterium]|nr:hypothetical protein [Candidatus Kaiserbacteria bacterium]